MGTEVAASMEIEGIRISSESVRHVLTGYAPRNEAEEKIYCMKLGLLMSQEYGYREKTQYLNKYFYG